MTGVRFVPTIGIPAWLSPTTIAMMTHMKIANTRYATETVVSEDGFSKCHHVRVAIYDLRSCTIRLSLRLSETIGITKTKMI